MARSLILDLIRPMARCASASGRRSPPISASIMMRPDLEAMEEATLPSLIPASWSTPPSRWISEVRAWTTFIR
jgi:hypothetical protein